MLHRSRTIKAYIMKPKLKSVNDGADVGYVTTTTSSNEEYVLQQHQSRASRAMMGVHLLQHASNIWTATEAFDVCNSISRSVMRKVAELHHAESPNHLECHRMDCPRFSDKEDWKAQRKHWHTVPCEDKVRSLSSGLVQRATDVVQSSRLTGI